MHLATFHGGRLAVEWRSNNQSGPRAPNALHSAPGPNPPRARSSFPRMDSYIQPIETYRYIEPACLKTHRRGARNPQKPPPDSALGDRINMASINIDCLS